MANRRGPLSRLVWTLIPVKSGAPSKQITFDQALAIVMRCEEKVEHESRERLLLVYRNQQELVTAEGRIVPPVRKFLSESTKASAA